MIIQLFGGHLGSSLRTILPDPSIIITETMALKQKVVVVGAGPVGSLAAIYAANRGHNVEIYELRGG